MEIIRPMQLSLNQRVLEQDRRFYFTVSATLGIDLVSGDEQIDAIYLKDAFQGNPDDPPLLDVGFPKPNGEFLVSGSFHAPGNLPIDAGEVKIRVGNMEKQLYVFGPRKWQNGLPTRPERFTTLPLIYQNAFGGEGYGLNPKGKGFKDGMLPLIEYPGRLVGSEKDEPVPACFSALDFTDPRRMQYKGTYDLDYKEKYFPGHPEDMDWRMFLSTPDDQWCRGFFTGDESYELHNVHPKMPMIQGRFPGLHARCFIRQAKVEGKTFGEIPLKLDTIWFFPEKLLGLLIFRGGVEVEDDEAETVTHMLGAYEYITSEPRPLAHYEAALEKRINSSDAFLKVLTTSDLIPEGHKCAMEVLFDVSQELGPDESEMAKNAQKKADGLQGKVDEQVDEAVQKAKNDGFSVDDLMAKTSADPSDPEMTALHEKMETILPGITTGDAKNMDMKHFSLEKFEKVSGLVQDFSEKKKKKILEQMEEKINESRSGLRDRIDRIDDQIKNLRDGSEKSGMDGSGQIQQLENTKKQLEQNLDLMILPDFDNPPKQPLPRPNLDMFEEQLKLLPAFPPELSGALQHLQAQKNMGIDNAATRALEEEIETAQKSYQDKLAVMKQTVEENSVRADKGFRQGYLLSAHHMPEGLLPHKEPLEDVRETFLRAISENSPVSDRDWACLDLTEQDLAGMDLSNTFLEQVNFKGANLKGANLENANLARACLDGADLSGANLKNSNIGGVSGIGTNFSHADMTSAKLSKSDFTEALFTGAQMEKIEAMELVLDRADLSRVHLSNVFFINTRMTGIAMTNARVELSLFIGIEMENTDFSDTVFECCAFIDNNVKSVCYDRADLSNSAFLATSPEKSRMEGISFREARFFQTNFMNMNLKNCSFQRADLEKAFFWSADLSGANLSHAYAKTAQFRKSKLTHANLDHINLYQGVLTKAHLVGASFKGANLCQADFLRSTITNTDFTGANLDLTLIENWRPR